MTAPAVPWPYPRDNPLTRARRIAMAYRAALGANNRALRDQLDQTFVQRGEAWVMEAEVTNEADGLDAVTTAEAAALVHVEEWEIRGWATEDDPRTPGRKLLPRFKRSGRSMTYLVRDVVDAARFKHGPVGLPQID